MEWLRWVAAGLAGFEAGFMVVDGGRALIVGDYLTPRSGEHEGQLGPWTSVVEAVGLEPRSLTMKLLFVVYGGAWLFATMAFALGDAWAWWAMVAFAVGSLWYLVLGTVTSVAILAVLLLPAVRGVYLG